MKKLTYAKSLALVTASFASGCFSAGASGSITVLGSAFNVDTISHFKVGPGTTTTYLRLTSPTESQLQVHYLTIDKTVPGVSIRAVCGTDMVAGTERVSSMAKRKSDANTLYFAGANADFFTTTGTATNGSTKVGSPTTSCTVDGEIYKTSNSQYQFSVDQQGVARIGRLDYYTGTATLGDKVTLFKGVNVASPNNGITIYTPKYWGSTNQNDKAESCYEVTARLVDGDEFVAGGKFRLVVTGEPSNDGDTTIPSDGYVIHGRGTSKTGCNTGALSFVQNLNPGDVVEFENIILLGDERIYPRQIVSGNPKTVGEGETLDTESERGDASAKHPRTGIGVSQDGNKIIMMVVEGRHNASAGVRTSQLADIMRYAGAYEAVNLDGGGSSTLYTSAFGIRNYCSDGSERAVGNGIFAVLDAPVDDAEVAEIQFYDWAPRLPQYGHYTPRIIGFNKYGAVVNDSITGYTLEIQPETGEIVDDGISYYSTKTGMFPLKAKYNGCEATVAVNVDNDCKFAAVYSSIFIDDKREYEVELNADNGSRLIPVKASVLDWSSSDADVVTVSNDGVVKGVADGNATITGVIGDNLIELPATVEVAKVPSINILENNSALSDWKFSKSGCSSTETAMTATDKGVDVDFKVSSTRGPSVTVTASPVSRIWSIPESLEFEVNSSVELKSINFKFKDAKGTSNVYKVEDIPAGETKKYTVDLSELIDTDNLELYPLSFESMVFYLPTTSGATGHIEVPAISAVYGENSGVGETIITDCDNSGQPKEFFNLKGIRVENPSTGIYIERQGNKAVKKVVK